MRTVYIKELHKYKICELSQIFKLERSYLDEMIKELLTKSIIKVNIDGKVEINFVGIVLYKDILIICYPKYLKNSSPLREMKQILKVLYNMESRKSYASEAILLTGEESNSMLSLLIKLFNDYYVKGYYTKEYNYIELNTYDEIYWDKTINEVAPVFNMGRPIYGEWFSKRTKINVDEPITLLHKIIMKECGDTFTRYGIAELFDMQIDVDTDRTLEDIGEYDYLISIIEKEKYIQFNEEKKEILNTLQLYISKRKKYGEKSDIEMYGTNNFKQVWEDVCQEIICNKYDTPINELKIPLSSEYLYNKNKLSSIIPKTTWYNNENELLGKPMKTLEPDILSFYIENGEVILVILDAKYYVPTIIKGEKIVGCPGVGDVTKQYLYELVYREFIIRNKIKKVYNCFLMPVEGTEIQEVGSVSFPPLDGVGLKKIHIRYLPAEEVYDKYLNNEYYSISAFNFREK